MSTRVLIIDDDVQLYALLEEYLAENGVQTAHASDGRSGLARLMHDAYDAVLLDIMMPGWSGLETLTRIRAQSAVPVIMLTAKGDETDRVVGLEMGADDYLAKPFSPRELLARIRAVLRRAQQADGDERLAASGVELLVGAREVKVRGKPVTLTGIEFDLLLALMRRPGRVIPRATLLDLAGRDDTVVADRTVDVHISHLRKKLGDDTRSPRIIKTVRGIGYAFARGEAA